MNDQNLKVIMAAIRDLRERVEALEAHNKGYALEALFRLGKISGGVDILTEALKDAADDLGTTTASLVEVAKAKLERGGK